jgi:hypothetical protein
MQNDFTKNNNLKVFEKKMLSILDHVSSNWGISYQHITDEKDWYCFNITCQDDDGASTGITIQYTPQEAKILDVNEWDDLHYEKSVKIILNELQKMNVKKA